MLEKFAVGVLIDAITYLANGWVMSILWGWFVVTSLGVPKLGVIPATGMVVMTTMLKSHAFPKHEDTTADAMGKRVAMNVIVLLFALSFGWLAHLFM